MSSLARILFGRQLGAPNPQVRNDLIIVQDRKAVNTAGSGLTLNTYTDRDLNTIILDTTGLAVVATPNITIPAGIWDLEADLITGVSSGSATLRHRLFNTTAAVVALNIAGKNVVSVTGGGAANAGSNVLHRIRDRFALAVSSQVKFQTAQNSTNNQGVAANQTEEEVYLNAVFRRVG